MNPLLLTFYGDDFTGSTDALEQLTRAGIRTILFIEPPTRAQLRQFKNLQAIGVAGMTRSLTAEAMERELRPALKKLKALGARHVHYKVCSTFDSSPTVGSIGRIIDLGSKIFRARFVPLLVAAPALGRFCVFGNLFARFGIGSNGAIHRLDRHPSISRHPVTPMQEADLRLHLARQTRKNIGLFDILQTELPPEGSRAALNDILKAGAEIVLFDALSQDQLPRIAALIDSYATDKRPLFSVGSSGIEMALGAHWGRPGLASEFQARSAKTILVASGSCSPVTSAQIARALKHGFAEVALDTASLADARQVERVIQQTLTAVTKQLRAGRSVIVHTSRGVADHRVAATTKSFKRRKLGTSAGARILGQVLGWVCRETLAQTDVQRLCVAGGDTSSYAARALGIEALEMIAPLTPGAPLCRAHAAGSPVDGVEVVFKGGQVGAEDYFETVRRGRP